MKKSVCSLSMALLWTILLLMPAGCSRNSGGSLQDAVDGRRSIRKYTGEPVSREVLDRIIKNGVKAPSGMNRQSYQIRVVDDRDILDAVNEAAGASGKDLFLGAPAVIFIANGLDYDLSQVDCGLLGQNIMLSAWNEGLGTCCMGAPIRVLKSSEACAPFIRRLGFSDGYNLLFAIAVGCPDESPEARGRSLEMVEYVN